MFRLQNLPQTAKAWIETTGIAVDTQRTSDPEVNEQDEGEKIQRKYGQGKDTGIASTSQLKGI